MSIEFDETLSPEDWSERLLTLPIMKDLGATLVEHPRSTIEPKRDRERVASPEAIATAGLLHTAPGGSLPGFVVRETLGEGGMGVVRVAEQSTLGRQVAIKTVRAALANDAEASNRLLREAWLTGRVEHPNVVPIYDLGVDEAGRPHIVMRKVEGTSWDALLRDPEAVRRRHGATDPLEWHLRVFVQVTQAVSRAHAKRIVHRDIKPENVMIGEFGEVYLLDWGIAVSLEPDPERRLPLASDATDAAGTPCYMAPEMLGSPTPRIDERTDIYLLGATLYEIVVGRPPHEGSTFATMVSSILYSSPLFPEDCPRELAGVCTRAMRRLHADRYPSVAELRAAVLDFLTHRGSSELAEEAAHKRAQLTRLLAGPVDAEGRQQAYNLFGAARFGYLEALRAWSENDEARAGLELVCTQMIDFELAAGSAEAAHAVLAEMTSPAPALRARVEEALRAREAEKARLAKLAHLEAEYDPSVGRRTRLLLAAILAVVGAITPFVIYAHREASPPMHPLLLRTLVAVAIAGGLLFWARDSISKTRLNRNLAFTTLSGLVMQVVLVPGLDLMGVSLRHHLTLSMFLWAFLATSLAITSEVRFALPAALYLAGFLASAASDSIVPFVLFAVGNVSNLVVVIAAWTTKDDLKRLGDRAKVALRR
ncbi:MAG TPA: serine/threonine-protein kinase [Polyangiaceae bacterium]|nr:serine/threonine-protein kinase [Polyangiaceae bacterium]